MEAVFDQGARTRLNPVAINPDQGCLVVLTGGLIYIR